MNLYKRVYPKWAQTYTESQDEMPIPQRRAAINQGEGGEARESGGAMEV